MHIELFTALKSLNVTDEKAQEVVEAVQDYIAMQISQATQPILNRMDSMQGVLSSKIDAIATVKAQTEAERERRNQLARWVVGTSIAAVAATLGVLKAFGVF
jgi:hypothetical protein